MIKIQLNPDNGDIEYASHTNKQSGGNYIAGPIELPLIGAPTANRVEGYSAVRLGYRIAGETDYQSHWVGFAPDPDRPNEFVYSDENIVVRKRFSQEPASALQIEIEIGGKLNPIEVMELAVSVPVNNDYSPWRFDQRYLYKHKVTEHLFPGGVNGYQFVERLSGLEPILYNIPLGDTRFEHVSHYPGSTDLTRPLIPNHSWPGCCIVYLHAKGYLEKNGFKPLIDERLVSAAALSPGERRQYRMELGFIADKEAIKELLVSKGKIYGTAVPGMTGPVDTVFALTASGSGKLKLSEQPGMDMIRRETNAGNTCWFIKFRNIGQWKVEVVDEQGVSAHFLFAVTDPLGALMERRVEYILDRQVYRKEGDALDGAILPYTINGMSDGLVTITGEGLYVKEDSIWGNGSYEGGITDAMFAAEKNSRWPNRSQIDRLEQYIERYVRRYLHNPQTGEVIWWCGAFDTHRAYNYVHVANLYFSMYRIARHYGLASRHTAKEYLIFAYDTLMKMYEIARPIDLVAGYPGGQRIFDILGGLQYEGLEEHYFKLFLKVRFQAGLLFEGDVPYGSECPYDNTGYEGVSYFAVNFNKLSWYDELARVMLAVRGEQPVWWWQGSDIRWWDAGRDFAECCHHYPSPLNSTALLLFVRRGLLKPTPLLLTQIYGGLLGSTAKIHTDGRASMSYGWEQESVNFGFHVFTGDAGLSLFGTLLGLRAYAYVPIEGGNKGYLCELHEQEKGELFIRPVEAAGQAVSWYMEHNGDFGDLDLSTGFATELVVNRHTGKLQMTLNYPADIGHQTEVTLRAGGSFGWAYVNGERTRLIPVAEGEYRVSFPVEPGARAVNLTIDRIV